MAAVPEVVERLSNDIQWTTELGNAFLAQQGDVMDAVQTMRKKAQDKGALESNAQQKVDTVVVENKTVIVVESTNPEVIYVPSYSPTVVYPPPVYPYPPIYYPPYPPGAAFVTFSVGVAMGAAFWGGSCCHAGWGHNNTVIINNNNNFNQNNNINRGQGGGGNWQHDPSHRGGAPYGDQRTANQYGGASRGQEQHRRGEHARRGRRGGRGRGAAPVAPASVPRRPGSATVRRPGSATARRPGSATVRRPGSATARRPGSATARRRGPQVAAVASRSAIRASRADPSRAA